MEIFALILTAIIGIIIFILFMAITYIVPLAATILIFTGHEQTGLLLLLCFSIWMVILKICNNKTKE